MRELEGIDWDMPIGDLRDMLVEIMQACCESASNVSAVVASEFYDAAREYAIGSTMGAIAEAGYSTRATEGAVRAFVQDVVDGRPDAPERIARKCAQRIDYEAKRAAANSIKANARRDRAKPRYARVPSGAETCEFCLMLASRGPVYHTTDSAGEGNHFHANCDCRIVPVWDSHREVTDEGGVIRRGGTQIEGYDPDAYYERYVRAMLDPDFRSKVRASADGASGSRESWSGKFARQKMHNNLSSWRESFAKAQSMDELRAMVADIEDFLDESGMGRAMSHAQWEALRSNLLAAKRRLEQVDPVGVKVEREYTKALAALRSENPGVELTEGDHRGLLDRVKTMVTNAMWEAGRKHHSLDELPKLEGGRTMSISRSVRGANPNWSEDSEAWSSNCVRCVATYLARRRGYRVHAAPFSGDDDSFAENWKRPFRDKQSLTFTPATSGLVMRSAIESQMARWGDGACAAVRVKWNDENVAHVFIAENVNGATMFVDPQTGEMDVSSYFDDSNHFETYLLRLDTNDLEPEAIECMD